MSADNTIIIHNNNNKSRTEFKPENTWNYLKKVEVSAVPFIVQIFQGWCPIVLLVIPPLMVEPHWKTGEPKQSCNLLLLSSYSPTLWMHLSVVSKVLTCKPRVSVAPETKTLSETEWGNKRQRPKNWKSENSPLFPLKESRRWKYVI